MPQLNTTQHKSYDVPILALAVVSTLVLAYWITITWTAGASLDEELGVRFQYYFMICLALANIAEASYASTYRAISAAIILAQLGIIMYVGLFLLQLRYPS